MTDQTPAVTPQPGRPFPTADQFVREVAEFLDVWDAAPAHRTGYRDVISSQKSGEDGRKLRATALRGVLAEVERLTAENGVLRAANLALNAELDDTQAEVRRLWAAHESGGAAFLGVCSERDQASQQEHAARQVLAHFVDDAPCSLDHDGACQAHGVSGPPCRNAEARRLLGMDADESADVCPDSHGRGDDFEGGTCGRCDGTGAAA